MAHVKFIVLYGISLMVWASAVAEIVPLSEADQEAYKKLIQVSECAYTGSTMRRRAGPSIQKVASHCGGKPEYICSGTFYCINSVSAFYVERAFCWANDNTGVRCPSANACARQAFFDQVGTGYDRVIAPKSLQESKGIRN